MKLGFPAKTTYSLIKTANTESLTYQSSKTFGVEPTSEQDSGDILKSLKIAMSSSPTTIAVVP
jgi:hypothetical protein